MSFSIPGSSVDHFVHIVLIHRPTDTSMAAVATEERTLSGGSKSIQKFPNFENQVGIIVIDSERVVGIELFDHPESWKVSSENVIKKYGEAFTTPTKGKSQTQIDDGQVEKAIAKFLELLLNASSLNDAKDGVHYVGGAGVKGEYTVLKSKVIHIIALRQGADDIEKEERRPRRVVMSWDVDEEPIRPQTLLYFSRKSDHLMLGY